MRHTTRISSRENCKRRFVAFASSFARWVISMPSSLRRGTPSRRTIMSRIWHMPSWNPQWLCHPFATARGLGAYPKSSGSAGHNREGLWALAERTSRAMSPFQGTPCYPHRRRRGVWFRRGQRGRRACPGEGGRVPGPQPSRKNRLMNRSGVRPAAAPPSPTVRRP
jgi:hypothetical protein